jgi:Zn-dependent protease
MNLVQCLAFALIGLALLKTGYLAPNAQRVIETGITLNAGLMVFNLVPIPPLDGSRVLRHLLGLSEEIFSAIARFAPLILIVLINLPFFSQALSSLIFLVATPFFALAGLLP